jgi:hypothetical protein
VIYSQDIFTKPHESSQSRKRKPEKQIENTNVAVILIIITMLQYMKDVHYAVEYLFDHRLGHRELMYLR